mgnify:CR=1 FL=1
MFSSSPCPLKRATAQNGIESAGTGWGKPGNTVGCSYNHSYFMNGAKIKSEEYQGDGSFGTGDDTACEFNKTLYHWNYLYIGNFWRCFHITLSQILIGCSTLGLLQVGWPMLENKNIANYLFSLTCILSFIKFGAHMMASIYTKFLNSLLMGTVQCKSYKPYNNCQN